MSSTVVGRQLINGLRKAGAQTPGSALATFADHLEKQSVGSLPHVDAETLQTHLDSFSGLSGKDRTYVDKVIGKLQGPTTPDAAPASGAAEPELSPEEQMRRLLGATKPESPPAPAAAKAEPEVELTIFADIVSAVPSAAEEKLAREVKQCFSYKGFGARPSPTAVAERLRDALFASGSLEPALVEKAVSRGLAGLRQEGVVPTFGALEALTQAGLSIPSEAIDAAWERAEKNVSEGVSRAFRDPVYGEDKRRRDPTAHDVAQRLQTLLATNRPASEPATIPDRLAATFHEELLKATEGSTFPGHPMVGALADIGVTVTPEFETKAWAFTLGKAQEDVKRALDIDYGEMHHRFRYTSRDVVAQRLAAALARHTPKGQEAKQVELFRDTVLAAAEEAVGKSYSRTTSEQLEALTDVGFELPQALREKGQAATARQVTQELARAFTQSPDGSAYNMPRKPGVDIIAQRVRNVLEQHTPQGSRHKAAELHRAHVEAALQELLTDNALPTLLALGAVTDLGLSLPKEVEEPAWARAHDAIKKQVQNFFVRYHDGRRQSREEIRDGLRALIDEHVPTGLQAAFHDRIHSALLAGLEQPLSWPGGPTFQQLAAFEDGGFPLQPELQAKVSANARKEVTREISRLLGKDNRDDDVASGARWVLESHAPPAERERAAAHFQDAIHDAIRSELSKGPVRFDRVSALESLGLELSEELRTELLEKAKETIADAVHQVLVTPHRTHGEPERERTGEEIRAYVRKVVRTYRPTSGPGSEATFFTQSLIDGVKRAVVSPFPPAREAVAAIEVLLRSDGYIT